MPTFGINKLNLFRRQTHYRELIAAKEADKCYTGITWDRNQLQMLQMIIRLHNLEVESVEKSKDEIQDTKHGDSSWVLGI